MVRTFLIADIRGYSTFTRERGDETAARLATKFAELARDAVEARGGLVIELRGDEALAVFQSTPQAVRAGLEFQEACREESVGVPELPLPVGVGIDRGEAIPVEEGYRGKALNMAARLCSRAGAGQVLVTKAVADLAGDLPEVEFGSLGAVDLKGFDRPVELLEARLGGESALVVPVAEPMQGRLPPELDDAVPLVDREHELRWLRGTWRQARRGHGRVVFVSGPAGIGKTRLAAELAGFVRMRGGSVRYAGSGGAGGAQILGAITDARSATAPALYVLDGVDLFGEAIPSLAGSAEGIESRPVLVLGLFRDAEGRPALAELVDRIDVRGDGRRVLAPLGLDGVIDIARTYAGNVDDLPAESMLRASGGVPARVHEVVGDWARDEANRRLAAAAEWLAAGKSKQAAELEFANNVIALKLGRIYTAPSTDVSESCPYKGLAPFEASDAPYFYGRERLVGELAARTVGMGLLGVVGPSGSGKSSVVLAGLLPSLAAGLLPGSERWGHAIVRPGEHPMDELESGLVSCDPGERLVLVIDQFEEVFTTTADESERADFIARLVDLARDPERAVVVVTIRGDFTDHCAPHAAFADLLSSNLVIVGPMTPEEHRRAIELPARRVGLRVESALVDSLVEEVEDEPGGLPLLSTALVELWQARDDGWLRLESYERTGGVRGAVARLAEASHEELSPPEREAARTVLLRLVGEGEGETAVRRRVSISEFDIDRDPAISSVLTRFTVDRLLTRNNGTIEIAHEALIREWPRLRGWLEDDATGRQLRTHLTQAAKQWVARDRDTGDLYRGARLSVTLDWAQAHDRELNELEREFLAQGRQATERDAERQRRTNRRLRGLLVGTAVFLVVALLAGALALVQRRHARNAQTAAEAQALQSDAERLGTLAKAEPGLDRSFLLGVAAVKLQDLPETRGDLLALLQKTPALIRVIPTPASGVNAVAVSPDGRLLASGDAAGVVYFRDLGTWKPSGEGVQLDGSISQQALAFSPNGATFAAATATADNKANLYLVDMASRTSKKIGSWPSIPASLGPLRFTLADFSPDGTQIAVAVATSEPGAFGPVGERLLLLEAETGRVVWERNYPLGSALDEAHVEFTPQGLVVTSARNGETLLWDTAAGRILRRFPFGGWFALSPDGHLAAVARNNENPGEPSARMAVLDLRTGRHRFLEDLPTKAWIVDLQFTPDGKSVVDASAGGGLGVWDLASGKVIQTFQGGLNVAVTPDGSTVLSEGVAWDLSGEQRFGRMFRWNDRNHGCPVAPCFVVEPQGMFMADDQGDGTVALIDLRSHRAHTLRATNGAKADALAFFPDGRTLATGGIDGTVTLWDVRSRSPVRKLRFSDPVWWVAVSPDGALMAVQTQAPGRPNSRVEVRDVDSGKVLFSHDLPNGGGDEYYRGGLYFSPDGLHVAALGCCQPGTTIEVWDARSGEELFSPEVGGNATSIAFSSDGRFLGAATADGHVILFYAHDGRRVGPPIEASGDIIAQISFSPDGRLFAVSSNDLTATLWDVESRKRIGNTFPIESGVVPAVQFASNGDLIIDYLGKAAQWPMDGRTWVRFACQVAGRDLTRAEWSDLLPDRPYQHVCPQ